MVVVLCAGKTVAVELRVLGRAETSVIVWDVDEIGHKNPTVLNSTETAVLFKLPVTVVSVVTSKLLKDFHMRHLYVCFRTVSKETHTLTTMVVLHFTVVI